MISAICLLLYPFVIQYKRGGLWNLLVPLALLTLLLDALANFTEWSVVFGWPESGDWTISQRLETMEKHDPLLFRREFASLVLIFLHACEPDGKH